MTTTHCDYGCFFQSSDAWCCSGCEINIILCCADRKFFDRIILCNSLVWSCELTGLSGLTYQEAVKSELRTRNRLASIPSSLRAPLLLLMCQTRRTSITDARDDIFPFVSKRFFVDEEVMATVGSNDRYVGEFPFVSWRGYVVMRGCLSVSWWYYWVSCVGIFMKLWGAIKAGNCQVLEVYVMYVWVYVRIANNWKWKYWIRMPQAWECEWLSSLGWVTLEYLAQFLHKTYKYGF